MRLWHYKLIPYLPNSQLLAQWRELNSIFKKQDKHILINYIYEYSKFDLIYYAHLIAWEFDKRNMKIKSWDNYHEYFKELNWQNYKNWNYYDQIYYEKKPPFKNHHNDRYLLQCFYNLQEKFDRGQKDFTKEIYNKLEEFVKSEIYKN